MRRTHFVAAIAVLTFVCGLAGLVWLRPQSTIPTTVSSGSNPPPSPPGRQGTGVPARIELSDPGVGVDTSEPPLKWELVDEKTADEASARRDPYRTWEDPRYVMKRPEDFPDVPADIRDELVRRDCRIPHWSPDTEAHNLVWGEFDHRGQRDLVVLCAHEGSANAYIFWAGDVGRLELLPFGQPGHTLTIGTAEGIEAHAEADARTAPDMPAAIDHDAIEDGCCECCSSYYYRHRGRWYRAAGAD